MKVGVDRADVGEERVRPYRFKVVQLFHSLLYSETCNGDRLPIYAKTDDVSQDERTCVAPLLFGIVGQYCFVCGLKDRFQDGVYSRENVGSRKPHDT